jgi:hypothetical protein
MSGVSPLLVGALVVVGAVAVAFVTVVAVVWHRMRRRWRALRSSATLRSGVALLWSLRAGGREPAPRMRFELWQSVADATRTVRAALQAGASVADLPSLCRRLRAAAEDLDRMLAVAVNLDPAGPAMGRLRGQVTDAQSAASAIRSAALASASDAASARVEALAEDAQREVQSVAAGIARSRALRSGQLPGA